MSDRQERFAGLLDDGCTVGGPFRTRLNYGHRLAGLVLDRTDQLRDLVRCPLRLLGELADLVGHDREPAALVTCTRCLDRGVERERVGKRSRARRGPRENGLSHALAYYQ